MEHNGLLLVDKPIGWTSFDVVNKVRGTIARELQVKSKTIKVGHSGTLDPMATGLLVLAIGKATKQMKTLTKLDKIYQVEATLGAVSDTGDSEGMIEKTDVINQPNDQEIKQAMNTFTGNIEQKPHKFSAIKVDGVRAYKLARRGKDFELEPRKVKIYRIERIEYLWPVVSFTAKVSSGTYIRSLVEDIGNILGTGAYMSQLRRTTIGEYEVNQAISASNLKYDEIIHSISPLD